jgi:outer membrane immunogenic protein
VGGRQRQRPTDCAIQHGSNGSTREPWLATARARLGIIPANRWLVYATGGLAAADVPADIAPSSFFTPESYVRPGWTAGAGIEAVVTGNWTAKIEYLFTGLEDHAYFVPTPNVANEPIAPTVRYWTATSFAPA